VRRTPWTILSDRSPEPPGPPWFPFGFLAVPCCLHLGFAKRPLPCGIRRSAFRGNGHLASSVPLQGRALSRATRSISLGEIVRASVRSSRFRAWRPITLSLCRSSLLRGSGDSSVFHSVLANGLFFAEFLRSGRLSRGFTSTLASVRALAFGRSALASLPILSPMVLSSKATSFEADGQSPCGAPPCRTALPLSRSGRPIAILFRGCRDSGFHRDVLSNTSTSSEFLLSKATSFEVLSGTF